MSGYRAVSTLDQLVTGELETIWFPRTVRPGTCGVVLLHGQGNPQGFMDVNGQKASAKLAASLANSGFPCVAGTMYGDAWGNNNGMTAMTTAKTVLTSTFPTIRSDKVFLLGISMGGAMMARFSQLYPSLVAAAVGMIPAYDPLAIYNYGNVGDYAMEQAWGFSGVGNFPDALNLGTKATLASTVPLLTAYASNDSIVPAASVTAYHTAAGGLPENIINVGALDHTDAAIAAVPISTIGRFLVSNGG